MWNMSTDLLGGTNKEVPLPICSAGLYSAVSLSILCPDWRRLSGGSDSSFVTLVAGFSSPPRLCSLWTTSQTKSPCVVILCHHGCPLNVSALSTQTLCKHAHKRFLSIDQEETYFKSYFKCFGQAKFWIYHCRWGLRLSSYHIVNNVVLMSSIWVMLIW